MSGLLIASLVLLWLTLAPLFYFGLRWLQATKKSHDPVTYIGDVVHPHRDDAA